MKEHLHQFNPSIKKFLRWPTDFLRTHPLHTADSCMSTMYYKIARIKGGATGKADLGNRHPDTETGTAHLYVGLGDGREGNDRPKLSNDLK